MARNTTITCDATGTKCAEADATFNPETPGGASVPVFSLVHYNADGSDADRVDLYDLSPTGMDAMRHLMQQLKDGKLRKPRAPKKVAVLPKKVKKAKK